MNSAARTSRSGYTLVEIMIAISIMGIMAGAAIPLFQPNVAVQLESTGRIIAADLAQVRDLAVSNNSNYRLTFDLAENRYYLEYSGTNAALATLPATIYRDASNTTTRRYTDLDDLPQLGTSVKLYSVVAAAASPTSITTLEFDALGATVQTAETLIWLSTGSGDGVRYVCIHVDPITGLARVDDITGIYPYGSGSGS
ncbi:MAG: type II secretion system GspH family protein [Planctomycetia bacterium]|nr:type II secretion system GspH family protein [Planctomycetia bacterium]